MDCVVVEQAACRVEPSGVVTRCNIVLQPGPRPPHPLGVKQLEVFDPDTNHLV
jgi:hypothetical protein